MQVNHVNSNTSFKARIDTDASKKLLGYVKGDPIMTRCVENWLGAIERWGDQNSVISLRKERFSGKDQFVLMNENFGGNKEIILSKPTENKPIITVFLDITQKAIHNAEKSLIKD